MEKRFKKYVVNGGVSCPFCGSEDLNTNPPEFDTGTMWQQAYCCQCDKKWTDTYRLVEAEETEE